MPMDDKPSFQSGQSFFNLRDLQALVRMIPRVIVGGRGIKVKMFGTDRVVVEATQEQAPPASGTKIRLFKVLEEKDDYLVCLRHTPGVAPSEDAEPVNVAKPYLLQREPFHNQTIDYVRAKIRYVYDETTNPAKIGTRIATVTDITSGDDNVEETDEGTAEAQLIVPPYYVGDIITAFQGDSGVKDEENKSVAWSDMNSGSRCWTHHSRHDPDDPNVE